MRRAQGSGKAGDQILLVDADDTLWENNIYFEEVFEDFVRVLRRPELTPPEIRAVLDEIELANRAIQGYGAVSFARNLRECCERIQGRPPDPEEERFIRRATERLLNHPIELRPGVAETLPYLAARHTLILFTKGHPDEQQSKVERSGLGRYFDRTAVVREKDAPTYRRMVSELALDPARVWMVGNSPKSDVNPALEAGLRAIYIPHPRTWSLEQEPIRDGRGRLLVLASFADLRRYF
ncbi:MAG: HAD hydrolase-like protein [Bryobacterales bacterium]|nr:HAD hydrolase-like protein [Bryobacteraceae bacterium]MDW8129892.1 HAD hydrolase-like protein [Bryobacterales bacterium]